MLFKDSSGTIAKYFYFRRMGKGLFRKAPEDIVKVEASHTGRYLKDMLKPRRMAAE